MHQGVGSRGIQRSICTLYPRPLYKDQLLPTTKQCHIVDPQDLKGPKQHHSLEGRRPMPSYDSILMKGTPLLPHGTKTAMRPKWSSIAIVSTPPSFESPPPKWLKSQEWTAGWWQCHRPAVSVERSSVTPGHVWTSLQAFRAK